MTKTLHLDSTSQLKTEQIAERLASNLRGGEVIELVSDLGGGKTTFVRGLARGLGSPDHVSSPTFKISNVYKGQQLVLYHFDFYRLPEAGLVASELAEVIGLPGSVVVIEWGDVVKDVLPPEKLTVKLSVTADDERRLQFSYPDKLAYLTKGLN